MIKTISVLQEGRVSYVTSMGNGGLIIGETGKLITADEFEIIRAAIFQL